MTLYPFLKGLANMLDDIENFFGSPIHTYSQAQALADGFLVDVTLMAQEAGFSIPVIVTVSVWHDYIVWSEADSKKQSYQDTEGRLWGSMKTPRKCSQLISLYKSC
jgi:hypothetical protein